jgi:hypothetical protein
MDYKAPEIEVLGTLAELTEGNNSNTWHPKDPL